MGKNVALLGLAFKPNTDDMREATSLVLSARLQAAGAKVRAYDPVAEHEARKLMPGLEFADDALGAVTGADAACSSPSGTSSSSSTSPPWPRP